MNWWSIYQEINFALTLLIPELLISHHYGTRQHFAARLVTGISAMFLLCYYWNTWFAGLGLLWVSASKYMAVFGISFIMIAACYQGDFWSTLFAAVIGYCIQHFAYQTFSLIKILTENQLSNVLQVILTFGILFGICAVMHIVYFSKMKSNTPVHVNNRLQAFLSAIILVITVYLSFYGVALSASAGTSNLRIVVLLFSILACVMAIMLELSFVHIKQNETEMAILKHMIHMAKDQYKESKESIELINIKLHDLRHQIRQLSGTMDQEELEKLVRSLRIYEAGLRTGNDALDIILMEKKLLCNERNIRLTCMINAAIVDRMNYSDIYSLFGNAIENAMEAVSSLPEDKRSISISGSTKGGYSHIAIENYFGGQIHFDNGLPQTQKATDFHGFGVKSMKVIVERYGGELEITTQGDIFRLDIYFQDGNAAEPQNGCLLRMHK